nr:hypothetical protein [Candidatus Sigynarchaeota archaeon]
GIQGEFVPYDISEDIVNLNASVDGALQENVTDIGFMFKFGVNSSNDEGKMKVDYQIGDFTNNGSIDPALANMSLSMITIFSGFHLMHGTRTITGTNLIDQSDADIDLNTSETRYIRRIRFASGTSLASRVFEMDLDSIPYESGGTSHTAYGQLIPARMGSIAWGRTTTAGNMTTQTGTALFGAVMLYAVNFPAWSGNAIVHDPVFSTFIPSTTDGKGLWFVIIASIAGIAAVVIIVGVVKAKKRDSSYPGYHGDNQREAKSRFPRVQGGFQVDFIHSFFFSFQDIASMVKHSGIPIDKYEPGIFEFFSGLVHEMISQQHVPGGTWEFTTSEHHDEQVIVPVQLLHHADLVVSEKIPAHPRTGKAYLYKVNIGEMIVHWLDVMLHLDQGKTVRISLLSKNHIDVHVVQALVPALREIATSLIATMGVDKSSFADACECIIARYLPTDLARPRYLASIDIRSFLHELHDDDGTWQDDMLAIETDLKMLSKDQGERIFSNFQRALSEHARSDSSNLDNEDDSSN